MISLKTNDWCIENIDTILFDKDGTFIDLHYFWGKMTELRVEEVIKEYNLDKNFFEYLCNVLGYDIKVQRMLEDGITALYARPKIIEIFRGKLRDKLEIETTQQEIENIFDRVNLLFKQDMNKYTKPITEAVDFIKSLNIKLGIVTSDTRESTMRALKYLDMTNCFNVILGSEDTKESKESGAPAIIALNILKSKPENTIVIGDTPMDYLLAKNGGLKGAILVSTGQISKENLLKHNDFVIESLNELSVVKEPVKVY